MPAADDYPVLGVALRFLNKNNEGDSKRKQIRNVYVFLWKKIVILKFFLIFNFLIEVSNLKMKNSK